MSHTAGLSVHGFPGYKNPKKLPTPVQVVSGGKHTNTPKVKSLFPPGEKFKYSGGGTTISQVILTDQTNMPYEEYMQRNVFAPLGMEHSYYYRQVRDNVANGHHSNGKQRANGYNTYPELAAAGLWTTPTDLARLIIELQRSLNGESEKVLSQATVKLMISPVLKGQTNGLGTFIEQHGDKSYFNHAGGNEGFRCHYYGSLEGGHGVVVMVNSDRFDIIKEIIRSVSSVYGWPLMAPILREEKITVPEKVLDSYAGTYTSSLDPTRTVTVAVKNGALLAEEKKRWKVSLIATGEREFITTAISPAPLFRFICDDQAKVTKLVILQSDVEHEWTKED